MRRPLTVVTPILPAPSPTQRSCEAAGLIGYSFDDEAPIPARRVSLKLAPGTATLITGPSGSGKSTLLRAVAAAAVERGWRVVDAARVVMANKPAVQLAGRDADSAMRRLAHAGLADAKCFVRRPRELSAGQRARLALAMALKSAQCAADRGVETVIIVDEFAAPLDRATAQSVATTFARALRGMSRVRAVVATAHDDLATALRAAEVARVNLRGEFTIEQRAETPPIERYDIEAGALADYAKLAELHYRSGAPASVVKVLRAVDFVTGETVGALVATMPTLNGAWRDLAWPGRYTTADKRVNARRLNQEVRRIARVVIDPRHRGVGVARRLVRAYLDEPSTERTEAVSSMGRWSAFFEHAGMRRIELPPTARDERLLAALAQADVAPFRLATPRSAWQRAVRHTSEAFMRDALRRWSQDRGHETQRLRENHEELWRRACKRVAAGMVVFVDG